MKEEVEKVVTQAEKEKEAEEQKRDQETIEKFGQLTPLRVKFSEYNMPPLIMKVLESMKVGELTHVTTDRLDRKLRGNFPNEDIKFDQSKIPEQGAKIKIWLHLLDKDQPEYFYKLTVKQKLERV